MTKWLIKCSLTRLLLVNPEIVSDKFVQQLSFQVSSLKKNLILVYFVLKQLKMLTKLSLVYLRGARGRLTGKDKKQYKLTS